MTKCLIHNPDEIDPHQYGVLQKIANLRATAWTESIGKVVLPESCLDEFELSSQHWCYFENGEPVAAARLSIHQSLENMPDEEVFQGVNLDFLPTPFALLTRLVVHPNYRGRWWPMRLDEIRMRAAEDQNCKCAIGSATRERLNQVQRRGFRVLGEAKPYRANHFYSGPPGLIVYCELPRTP